MRSGAERDSRQMRDKARRPSYLRLLLLAVLAALAFAGGVLAGDSANNDRPADFHAGGSGPGEQELKLELEERKQEEEELHRAQERDEEQKRLEAAELRQAEEKMARGADEAE